MYAERKPATPRATVVRNKHMLRMSYLALRRVSVTVWHASHVWIRFFINSCVATRQKHHYDNLSYSIYSGWLPLQPSRNRKRPPHCHLLLVTCHRACPSKTTTRKSNNDWCGLVCTWHKPWDVGQMRQQTRNFNITTCHTNGFTTTSEFQRQSFIPRGVP